MSTYAKKKKPGLLLYHEDLNMLKYLPDSDIAIIVRLASAYSQALADGVDEKPAAPPELSGIACALYDSIARKAAQDQGKYEGRARSNAENALKRWGNYMRSDSDGMRSDSDGMRSDSDGMRSDSDGQPSISLSKTLSKTLSSSSSSNSDRMPSDSDRMPSDSDRMPSDSDRMPSDDRTDDDDEKELLPLCDKLANIGINGGVACMEQLKAWHQEYGLEALSDTVNKAVLHGAKSLAYISTSLANRGKPKPTKDNSYSQRDYSSEENAMPAWQAKKMAELAAAEEQKRMFN